MQVRSSTNKQKQNLQNLGKNHPQNLDPKRIKKKVCNYFTSFCWKRVEVWRLQLCFNLCTACFGVLAQNCGTFNIAKWEEHGECAGWMLVKSARNWPWHTQRKRMKTELVRGNGLHNNGLMRACSAWKCSWSSCFFASNSASVASKNTKNPSWHII